MGRGARGAQRGLSLSQGITSDSEQACALSKLHTLQHKGRTCRNAVANPPQTGVCSRRRSIDITLRKASKYSQASQQICSHILFPSVLELQLLIIHFDHSKVFHVEHFVCTYILNTCSIFVFLKAQRLHNPSSSIADNMLT